MYILFGALAAAAVDRQLAGGGGVVTDHGYWTQEELTRVLVIPKS